MTDDKGNLKNAFELVILLVKRELQVKYRGTLLGYLWSMLNPLLTMLIISFVFSHLVKGIQNYNLYVLSGLLIWNMVSVALQTGSTSIVGASSLVRKVKLRLWIFPMVSVCSAVVNLILSFIPYVVFYFFATDGLPTSWPYLPVVLVLLFLFVAGLTLMISVASVFFRDVAHVLGPVLQLAFYATPIIYSRDMIAVSEKIQSLLALNPFVHYVEAFRAATYPNSQGLELKTLVLLTAMSIASMLLGLFVYKLNKAKIKFAL